MSRKMINELREGERAQGIFLLRDLRLTPFRGKPGNFLSLTLGDRTGEIEAKVWENADQIGKGLKSGQVLEVDGFVNLYRDRLQLKIDKLQTVKGKVPWHDLVPSSPREITEMLAALREIVLSVQNQYLHNLLCSFFDDTTFLAAYSKAPAAKKMHQAYLGGLLEHSLNVASVVAGLFKVYPAADRDLLITGALLHDVGKLEEFKFDTDIDYTVQGRLLGHIVLGVELIGTKITAIPGFPEELKVRLLHMIVSHHGQYEWQSPKKPKFLEAMLLHQADLLDSQVCYFLEAEGEGMVFNKSLGRYIYRGEREAASDLENDN